MVCNWAVKSGRYRNCHFVGFLIDVKFPDTENRVFFSIRNIDLSVGVRRHKVIQFILDLGIRC